jgi:hypothetical protein
MFAALAIDRLAAAMRQSTALALLVARTSGATLLAARPLSAALAAVSLAPVAAGAQRKVSAAARGATAPLA